MKRNIEKILEEKVSVINKIIEKYIPREYNTDSLIFTLGASRYEYNTEAVNKTIADPIWEFLDRGGKRWRPSLFLFVCEALGAEPEKLLDFAIIPEVIHNGTLMIDDVEDASEIRRGKPCTYKLFGLDTAINTGNVMYYLPLLVLIKNKVKISMEQQNRIYEIYVQEMTRLSFGQAMDIAWHKGLAEANEKQYLQMCAYKTGTLARMSAKMAAVLAGASDDTVERMGRFAETIGVAFQIQDDVLDLVGEKFAEKKGGRGQDITEGKRSLMVIHTLEKAEPADKMRLLEILDIHTNDQKLKDEAISIIKNYGSIRYGRWLARGLIENGWKEIDKLLQPSDAKEKLKAFAHYLVERKI